MPKLQNKQSKQTLAAMAVVAFGIIFYFLLQNLGSLQAGVRRLGSILSPFLVGGIIAYIVTPLCNRLNRWLNKLLLRMKWKEKRAKKTANALSIVLSLLLVLALVVLLLALMIPQLVTSITSLISAVPGYAKQVEDWLDALLTGTPLEEWFHNFDLTATVRNWVSTHVVPNADTIFTVVTSRLSSVFTLIYNLIIGFIVSFYCLSNRVKFSLQGKKALFALLPFRWAKAVLVRLRFADKAFSGFITGKLLDSLIIGVITFFGCMIPKVPYYPLIAVFIGITNIIPFFGPFLGAIPSLLLILIVDPFKAIYFLIFVILLQQFDGNILGPRILSSAVGVPGFWVLFSIMLFGGLFGVIGMVIGTPLFAVIYSIVKDILDLRLKRKSLPVEAWNYRDMDSFEEAHQPKPLTAESARAFFAAAAEDPRDLTEEDDAP